MEKGNTVVVIEHNLDVAAHADYIIDMGPGGGRDGGQIVATGTPEQVARLDSPTAPFLAEELAHHPPVPLGEPTKSSCARKSRKGSKKLHPLQLTVQDGAATPRRRGRPRKNPTA